MSSIQAQFRYCICSLGSMGVSIDPQEGGKNGGQGSWSSLNFLTRRKRVDAADNKSHGQLAKDLSVPHLIAIGNFHYKCFYQYFKSCVCLGRGFAFILFLVNFLGRFVSNSLNTFGFVRDEPLDLKCELWSLFDWTTLSDFNLPTYCQSSVSFLKFCYEPRFPTALCCCGNYSSLSPVDTFFHLILVVSLCLLSCLIVCLLLHKFRPFCMTDISSI